MLALLLGVLHQGGVLPALLHLHSTLPAAPASVFFWKTYMPPWHLLGARAHGTRPPPRPRR